MPIKIQEVVKVLYLTIDGQYEADDYQLVVVREFIDGCESYRGKLYRQEFFQLKPTFANYYQGDDEVVSSELLFVYDGHAGKNGTTAKLLTACRRVWMVVLEH